MEKSAHVERSLGTQQGGDPWAEHELQPNPAHTFLPALTIPRALYQQMELHCLLFLIFSHPFKQTFPSLIYLPFKKSVTSNKLFIWHLQFPRQFPLRVNHISLHSARANGFWIIKAGRFSLFYFMTKLSWVKPGIIWMSIEQIPKGWVWSSQLSKQCKVHPVFIHISMACFSQLSETLDNFTNAVTDPYLKILLVHCIVILPSIDTRKSWAQNRSAQAKRGTEQGFLKLSGKIEENNDV